MFATRGRHRRILRPSFLCLVFVPAAVWRGFPWTSRWTCCSLGMSGFVCLCTQFNWEWKAGLLFPILTHANRKQSKSSISVRFRLNYSLFARVCVCRCVRVGMFQHFAKIKCCYNFSNKKNVFVRLFAWSSQAYFSVFLSFIYLYTVLLR